jgi:hypothetical protein
LYLFCRKYHLKSEAKNSDSDGQPFYFNIKSDTYGKRRKMRHWKFIDMRMFAAVSVLFFIFGCSSMRGGGGVEWGSIEPTPYPQARDAKKKGPPPHAPAHGYRAKHAYRYYPSREVYYDTGRRIYFYIEGQAWKSGASLPNPLQVGLGDYRTVEIDSDTPYEYHEKTKHGGKHNAPPGKAKK